MGSKLQSDKAIKLLDYRGQKEFARTLRRWWLELDVQNCGSFVNHFAATVQVHAPLKEYELLRNLPSPEREALLKIFKELCAPQDVEIGDIGCVLEIEDQTPDQLVTAIEEQKSLMISVGTGERRIQDANEEYKMRRGEVGKMLQSKGIKDPNTFFDLWGWFKRFKSGDVPTYASRRQFMSELYDPLLEQLQQDGSSTPGMFDEPTGWAKVDRAVTEIRQRLEQATTEEQFQAVGTLCREALISLAQAACDSAQHPTLDSVKASPTDFKRMIEAYSAAELAGASKEASRRHAKAAFDVANELQHKRTADFRHAALLRGNCRSHKSHCDCLRSLRPLAKERLWTMMMQRTALNPLSGELRRLSSGWKRLLDKWRLRWGAWRRLSLAPKQRSKSLTRHSYRHRRVTPSSCANLALPQFPSTCKEENVKMC